MWEGLIQKAKDGGVDVIETYVFWNLHEPSPGKVTFFSSVLVFVHYVLSFVDGSVFRFSMILKGEMIW